jgi:hypothetical protein
MLNSAAENGPFAMQLWTVTTGQTKLTAENRATACTRLGMIVSSLRCSAVERVRPLAQEVRQGAFAEDPEAGYLKDKTSAWLPSHFNPASYKAKRRKYFASPKK